MFYLNRMFTMAFVLTLFVSAASSVQAKQGHDLICQKAQALVCLADDMRDEIKCHLRGTKGYGRILGSNAVVRGKAAALQRRVSRNACYRRLVKDACKLHERVCKLEQDYLAILACSSYCRPVKVCHIEAYLAEMKALAQCIHIEACHRAGAPAPVYAEVHVQRAPIVAEPFYNAPIVEEPSLAPAFDPHGPHSVLDLQLDPVLPLPSHR